MVVLVTGDSASKPDSTYMLLAVFWKQRRTLCSAVDFKFVRAVHSYPRRPLGKVKYAGFISKSISPPAGTLGTVNVN